jgi:hypothetical protein
MFGIGKSKPAASEAALPPPSMAPVAMRGGTRGSVIISQNNIRGNSRSFARAIAEKAGPPPRPSLGIVAPRAHVDPLDMFRRLKANNKVHNSTGSFDCIMMMSTQDNSPCELPFKNHNEFIMRRIYPDGLLVQRVRVVVEDGA